jgi:hypothetical protein
MTSPGERRLVARILGGGPVALGVLYDLFGPVVHEVAPLPVADEGAVRAVTRSSRDARGARRNAKRLVVRASRGPRACSGDRPR